MIVYYRIECGCLFFIPIIKMQGMSLSNIITNSSDLNYIGTNILKSIVFNIRFPHTFFKGNSAFSQINKFAIDYLAILGIEHVYGSGRREYRLAYMGAPETC